MYIRSSIITVLLAATILNNHQQVEAFPTGFSQFAQFLPGVGGSGGGEAQGSSSPQAGGNGLSADVSKLVTDVLGGGGANPDMEKRFTDDLPTSGSGQVMSSGNEKSSSVAQSAVDIINDISSTNGGATTIIKRGGHDDNKMKKNNKRKNKKNDHNKKMGQDAPAKMATSLRRRGLIPGLGGAGGGAGGLSGVTGMLSGDKGGNAASDESSGGGKGFKMALIGGSKRRDLTSDLTGKSSAAGNTDFVDQLLGSLKLSQTTGSSSPPSGGLLKRRDVLGGNSIVQELTGTLKLGQTPGKGDSGFAKNSDVQLGSANLPLARRQGLEGLPLDELLGLNNDAPSAASSQDSLSSSSTPVNNNPQIKVLDHVLGGNNNPSSPMDSFGTSKLSTEGGGINNSPTIDVLKTRSLNSLSGADRMAKARQGVVVDSDDNPSQETMKRDNNPTNSQQQSSSSPQSFAPPPPNPQQQYNDFMYAQPLPPTYGEKLSQSPDTSSEADKKGKKKGGGGGFSMALVSLPTLGRRQLDSLTGGDGNNPADGLQGIVSKLTNDLNIGGGSTSTEKHTVVNEIKQSSPQKSTATYSSNGNSDLTQDARMDIPNGDGTDATFVDDGTDATYVDDGSDMSQFDDSMSQNGDMYMDGGVPMDGNDTSMDQF